MQAKGPTARLAIESKLADWHRLYKELGEAERRLKQARVAPPAANALTEMETQVAQLKRRSDDALSGVHAALGCGGA
jgi:hypothetical protein